MPLISLLIALELIAAGFTMTTSSRPSALSKVKHIGRVLGVSLIAQETGQDTQTQPLDQNSPPPSVSSDQSSQQTSSPGSNTSTSTPAPENTTANETPEQASPTTQPQDQSQSQQVTNQTQETIQQQPQETNSFNQPESSNSPNMVNEILNLSPTPSDASSDQSPTSAPSATLTPTQDQITQEASISQQSVMSQNNVAVVNPDDIVSTPEHINQKTIDTAQKQDDQLDSAKTPQEQNQLLVGFARENIKNIEEGVRGDDFSSASYITQRLNSQLDSMVSNLQTVSPKQNAQLKKAVVSFCNQADIVLRNQQLSVPEDAEQDLEIARGKCLSITQ